MIRMGWGNDQRLLLPASALAGGSLLVLADTLARTVIAPQQLPVGVLTALLGVTAPLRRLVGVFGPLQQGIAAGRGIFELIDTPGVRATFDATIRTPAGLVAVMGAEQTTSDRQSGVFSLKAVSIRGLSVSPERRSRSASPSSRPSRPKRECR